MANPVWGWVAFLVCSGFFIAGSIKAGDILFTIGSIIFFGACVTFMVPLITRARRDEAIKRLPRSD